MIPDASVDGLVLAWVEEPGWRGPRVVGAPPELRMFRDFLTRSSWQHFVRFIAPGVLARHGRVAEYSGFQFASDLEPGDEPFEGVELFDPIDTLHVSEGAFDRLMSRYFDCIIEGVHAHGGPEAQQGWWPELVRLADQLRQRAG